MSLLRIQCARRPRQTWQWGELKLAKREDWLKECDLRSRCYGFVEKQSLGEWSEELVAKDATRLVRFVKAEIKRSLAANVVLKSTDPKHGANDDKQAGEGPSLR